MLRLLRHARAEVRWTVAMALERVFALPSGVAARLREDQAPDADTRHAFAERWAERNAAVALERGRGVSGPGRDPFVFVFVFVFYARHESAATRPRRRVVA